MSNKLSPTRGLHRVEPVDREYAIATKITGRNLAAVSYIVSLEAERREVGLDLRAKFGEDGRLLSIMVYEVYEGAEFGVTLRPGDYLVLDPDENMADIMSADDYNERYRRVEG